MDKEERKKLFQWLAAQKCPRCKCLHKTVDIEETVVLCECEKCAKQWSLNYKG